MLCDNGFFIFISHYNFFFIKPDKNINRIPIKSICIH